MEYDDDGTRFLSKQPIDPTKDDWVGWLSCVICDAVNVSVTPVISPDDGISERFHNLPIFIPLKDRR